MWYASLETTSLAGLVYRIYSPGHWQLPTIVSEESRESGVPSRTASRNTTPAYKEYYSCGRCLSIVSNNWRCSMFDCRESRSRSCPWFWIRRRGYLSLPPRSMTPYRKARRFLEPIKGPKRVQLDIFDKIHSTITSLHSTCGLCSPRRAASTISQSLRTSSSLLFLIT